MVGGRMAECGVRIAAPPSEQGCAVHNDIPPPDQARLLGQMHEQDKQCLERRGARVVGAFALLGGTGNLHSSLRVTRQSTRLRQRGPVHQPVMQVLVGQAPQRAQQRHEQQRFLSVAARTPARTRRYRRGTPPLRPLHGEAAQRQQM